MSTAPVRPGGAIATVIVLAAWLGAAVYFSVIVARAAFRTLPTRSLAGALVGETLPAVFITGIIACAIAALLAAREPASVPGRTLRLATSLVAMALCLFAQFIVDPRIERLRARLGSTLDSLPAGDPGRVAFGRLHALSVLALGAAMLLALAALLIACRTLLPVSSD